MHILHVLLLLTLTGKQASSYKDCSTFVLFGTNPSNKWGNKCEHKCRCVLNYCNQDGTCRSKSRCDPSWFGYKCQFKNMVSEYGYSEYGWLIDQNSQTCQPNLGATTVGISFVREIPFSWMRLTFKQAGSFNVTFNFDTVLCPLQRVFVASSTEYDVACGLPVEIGQISIHGEIVKWLCEVAVNGGEDVAIPQYATQSSEYKEDGKWFPASLAHDGVHRTSILSVTCSHTAPHQAAKGYWDLYYSSPVQLYRIHIYNRIENDLVLERLMFFVLKMYDAKDQLVYTYHEPGDKAYVYNLTVTHITAPIKHIWISSNSYSNILTLCEVETFGEYICPESKWGTWCDQTCSCQPQQSCFAPTGACLDPCPAGFYGVGCNKKCSDNCDESGCTERAGHCFGCDDGFTGEDCDQVCPHGKYGKACLQSCSQSCPGNECHHSTGGCLYCPDGHYGSDCSLQCSDRCTDGKCYSQHGKCLSCSVGFHKDQCDSPCVGYCNDSTCNQDTGYCRLDCPPGFYGAKCVKKCFDKCDSCDTDKKCLECSHGYSGKECADVCHTSCSEFLCDYKTAHSVLELTNAAMKILAAIFIVAIIVVVIVFVAGFMFFRG